MYMYSTMYVVALLPLGDCERLPCALQDNGLHVQLCHAPPTVYNIGDDWAQYVGHLHYLVACNIVLTIDQVRLTVCKPSKYAWQEEWCVSVEEAGESTIWKFTCANVIGVRVQPLR